MAKKNHRNRQGSVRKKRGKSKINRDLQESIEWFRLPETIESVYISPGSSDDLGTMSQINYSGRKKPVDITGLRSVREIARDEEKGINSDKEIKIEDVFPFLKK